MTDNRPYCLECDVRMEVDKNEVMVPYSATHIQYGDRYECPKCEKQIVIGFGEPIPGKFRIYIGPDKGEFAGCEFDG